MTTVAYNHKDKEIAVDSRFSRGDIISTDNGIKVFKEKGVTFVCAGLTSGYKSLIEMWFSMESKESLMCSAFVVDNGVIYEFGLDSDGVLSKEALSENLCKGSGEFWAMAAMDFGCSAKEAVKYAMTRDMYTGGKIRVIKVK